MTDATNFTITKLTVIDGNPNDKGNRLLAVFNLDLGNIEMVGCALVEKSDSTTVAVGPIGKNNAGNGVRVRFTDPTLVRAITRRAAAIYGGYTGREVSSE